MLYITISHVVMLIRKVKNALSKHMATKNDEPSSEVTIKLSIVIQYSIMSMSNRISLRRRMLIHSQRKTMLLVGYYTHQHITSTYICMYVHMYTCVQHHFYIVLHRSMHITGYM